jgi:hypothetical protein
MVYGNESYKKTAISGIHASRAGSLKKIFLTNLLNTRERAMARVRAGEEEVWR